LRCGHWAIKGAGLLLDAFLLAATKSAMSQETGCICHEIEKLAASQETCKFLLRKTGVEETGLLGGLWNIVGFVYKLCCKFVHIEKGYMQLYFSKLFSYMLGKFGSVSFVD
jgi:hypothetical protein